MHIQTRRWVNGTVALILGITAAGLIAAPALAAGHGAKGHRHHAHVKKHHKRTHHKRTHHKRKSTPHGGPATTPAAQQSASGNLTATVFSANFSATRAENAAPTSATGEFTARTGLGSATVMTVSGPVTCLDVVGNEVGLFYPITSSTPSILGQLNATGVYFYAQLGANGKPKAVNFVPVPTTHASSCAPLPSLIPVSSGTLTLSP